MKSAVCLLLAAILISSTAAAERPQILPDPMLVNLYALTEAAAALRICAESSRFDTLSASEKDQLQRLQGLIEELVHNIARKFDDDLFPFFVASRNEAAARPDKIEDMRMRYDFCTNGFIDRMKAYVYDSRRKLDYFLSEQPDAK